MLNLSLSISHIVLSLLLFFILITWIHHLCSHNYITIYIVIENLYYDQNCLGISYKRGLDSTVNSDLLPSVF